MATRPQSMALNDLIAGISAASPDTLYDQIDGIGTIGMAVAYNSSAGSETVSVYVLDNANDAADVDPTWVQEIPAGRSVILPGLIGQVIPNDGKIQAFASTTNVVQLTISGSISV